MAGTTEIECPQHGTDIKREGYDIGEGWLRCPTAGCLFTRTLQG